MKSKSEMDTYESEGIGDATSVSGRSGGISIASCGRIFISSVIGSMIGTITHYLLQEIIMYNVHPSKGTKKW